VHSQGRTTTTDVELHGVTIPAVCRVAVIMGAANRDERQFGPGKVVNR
jgi:cytochrome P450